MGKGERENPEFTSGSRAGIIRLCCGDRGTWTCMLLVYCYNSLVKCCTVSCGPFEDNEKVSHSWNLKDLI